MLRKHLIAVLLGVAASPALAQQAPPDPIVQDGREGSALGSTLRARAAQMPTVGPDGKITLPTGERIAPEDIVPGAHRGDIQALKDLEGASAERLDEVGKQAMRAAERDPRAVGGAYRGLLGQRKDTTEPLLQDDALWGQTMTVLQQARSGMLGETFAACTTETRYRDIAAGARHQTHVYTCEQLNRLADASRVRNIEVAEGVIDGQVFESNVVRRDFLIDLPVAVPPNALTVEWQPVFDGNLREILLEVEPTAQNAWTGTWRGVFEDRPCDGVPEGQGCIDRPQWVRIGYTGSYLVFSESLDCAPEDCLLETDGFCTAEWTCTDEGPRTINGVVVDERFASLMAPLFPGQTGLCFAARAEYRCDYAVGTMCWTRPDGTQACVTNEEGGVEQNTCDRVRQQPGVCAITRRECTEDSRGHNDFCYVESVTYTCNQPIRVTDLGVEVSNTCSGAVRCMGEECLNQGDTAITTQSSIAGTQARLVLAQHLLSDWEAVQTTATATSSNKAGGVDLEYFRGEPLECRKALGGLVDCCTQTTGGGLDLWFSMYPKFLRQVNADIAESRLAGEGSGGWKYFAEERYENESLNKSFTSTLETVRGGVHGGEGTSTPVAEYSSPAGNMAPLKPAFIERARSEVQDPGWACTQEEFDLAVQREVGMCAKVGQRCAASVLGACLDKRDVYCCFNSPLSKTIRTTMAGGESNGAFGTARRPDCSGVSQAVVEGFDWNQVSMDDLVARMERAGALPNSERIASLTSMENLTGQQSSIVREEEVRKNVMVRTQARVAEVQLLDAHLGIKADQQENVPDAVEDPNVVGEVTFAQGFDSVGAGQRVLLQVIREGSAGSVGVHWSTRDGTAIAGRDYRAARGFVQWSGGEGAKEPQLLAIETLQLPRVDGQPAREFYVDLREPSGGAVLGNRASTTIKISNLGAIQVLPGEPPGDPHLSFQKRFVGAAPAGSFGGMLLGWDVIVTNASRYPVRRFTVYDVPGLPAWAGVDPTREVFSLPRQNPPRCLLGMTTGSQNPFGQPYATCTANEQTYGSSALMPGESVVWRLYSAADPGSTASNMCGAQAVFDMGGGEDRTVYYAPGNAPGCEASGTMPLAGTGPLANCEAARAPTAALWGGALQHQLALSGFPGTTPGSGDSLGASPPVRTNAWSIYNETLEVPSGTSPDLRMRLGFQREEGRFASTVAVTITPCPRDLRPAPGANEQSTPAACRYVGPPYALPGGVAPGFTIGFGGAEAEGVCRLQPGSTYYLNYAFYDTRQPIVAGQSTCEAPGQECSLLFDWDALPRP